MATPTLSTGLSRRAMLAGSVAVPALAHPLFQALAALPSRDSTTCAGESASREATTP